MRARPALLAAHLVPAIDPPRPTSKPKTRRRFLVAVLLVASALASIAVPAIAKTPYFSIETTPLEATADGPVVIDVTLWADEAHMVPGGQDEWVRSFADQSPRLDALLVVRIDNISRVPSPWRLGAQEVRPDGAVDLPVTLRRSGLDTYQGVVWLPEGTWSLVAFPDRTGWSTPSLSPGYPDITEVTVRAGADVDAPCPVTPMGPAPDAWADRMWGSPAAVGDEHLWVGGFGADSVVLARRDQLQPDGTIGAKIGWWRITPGALSITGHRLDRDAPPLSAHVPDGYGSSGFQVSGVTFPTEGCWEVTGTVGDHSLTVVVYVLLR